jgi:2-polyprenyl-3-methyl-5-hydroxy-6-metoxy-1,4-benzoquinol methylase
VSLQSPAISEPAAMTEILEACPACDSIRVSVLHTDLKDRLFGCPGTWTLWECHECGVGFLNPRLTADAIGQAYLNYFTHGGSTPRRTLRTRFRDFAVRSYQKRHFGRRPAIHLIWADWVIRLRLAAMIETLHAANRYLPRPWPGAVLLDVGCGDGEFLRCLKYIGWRAVGLETDSQACAIASACGLDVVEGAVPNTGLPCNSFDIVTLNHVIEHVHNPRAVLRELLRLMKPNGRVFLTTPNWRSYGSALFGRFWYALDPPRHLVLFTPDALVRAALEAGFVRPEVRGRTDVAHAYFLQSHALALSARPESVSLPAELVIEAEKARTAATRDPNQAEEFTLIATKPGVP